MKRYSEFINFPIYIWGSKEIDVEVPADEDESNDGEESRMYYLGCWIGYAYITVHCGQLSIDHGFSRSH